MHSVFFRIYRFGLIGTVWTRCPPCLNPLRLSFRGGGSGGGVKPVPLSTSLLVGVGVVTGGAGRVLGGVTVLVLVRVRVLTTGAGASQQLMPQHKALISFVIPGSR